MIERERLDGGEVLDRGPGQARDVRLDDALAVGGEALAPGKQQSDQQRAACPTHNSLYRPARVEVNAPDAEVSAEWSDFAGGIVDTVRRR